MCLRVLFKFFLFCIKPLLKLVYDIVSMKDVSAGITAATIFFKLTVKKLKKRCTKYFDTQNTLTVVLYPEG